MTPQIREWAEQYQAGASLRTIATQAGVTHKTVRARLIDAGISRRPRSCAHNPPPVEAWRVDVCLDCGIERKVRHDGYCWHCSRPQTTPVLQHRFGTM